MDLVPSLNFNTGIGEATIRDRFGESVNFSPSSGSREFILLVSVGRCKFRVSEETVGSFFKPRWVAMRLILACFKSLIRFFNSWLDLEMWVSISIIFCLSLVNNIKSPSIYGAMRVLIGLVNNIKSP
jgi:hypothetical protein